MLCRQKMHSDGKRNYSKMKHHPPYLALRWSDESDDRFCRSNQELPRRKIVVYSCWWPFFFFFFLGILMRTAVAATTLSRNSQLRRPHRKNQEEFCEWASVPTSNDGIVETLHLPDDTTGDAFFGGSSDLSSFQPNTEGSTVRTAVVGGPRYNDQRGIAKVYLLDSSSSDLEGWRTEVASVEGEDAGDRLGADVAVSADGSTVALGVPGARQVQVFLVDDAAAGMTTLVPVDGNEDDFGFTVSLSTDGRWLAVGSVPHSFLYRREGSDWMLMATFADPQERSYGTKTVSLSGDAKSMAMGGGFFGDGGRVRVVHGLDNDDPTSWWWSEPTDDLNNLASIDNFDLSADGKHLVVMANANEDEVVRVYKLNEASNVWVQQGQDPSGFSAGDGFGNWNALSLSADGGVLAVGAYAHNNGTGYARVYKFFEESWQPVGSDLVGDEIGDSFGTSVALDSFGGQLIVGALFGGPTNDGSVQHFVIQADCLESQPASLPTQSPTVDLTDSPAASPTVLQRVEQRFEDMTMEFVGVQELTLSEQVSFTRITEDWFEAYYSNQEASVESVGVYDMETSITFVDQTTITSAPGSVRTIVTFDQTLTYLASDTAQDARNYITLPYLSPTERPTYETTLMLEIPAFATLQTPIEPPHFADSGSTESGDSGTSIGAIAGSAVGAVLVIGSLGFVVARKQQKRREPSTTAPISVSADALGGPDHLGEEPSIPMAEAFVLESQTETSTRAMSDPCGIQAKPGLPSYKDQAREVAHSQRQPPQGRGVETGDVPGFKDQVRSAEPQKRVIEAKRVG